MASMEIRTGRRNLTESTRPVPPSRPRQQPAGNKWSLAEESTVEIIRRIQPSEEEDELRMAIIDYVQKLINNVVYCEVFPYGSVPLRTYLTDGDIDLTILVSPYSEFRVVIQIFNTLQMEIQKEDPVFEVKDVQFIDAEVKIIKCLIQDIVVDISFNQIGGLGALCFLEKVDRLLAENHLIKCSILLIKAWCYYESHILGAYHGLIPTYALEILVLYIINHFHSSLTGPFAVLYKFLDYYSKFDWKNYCITLSGPAPISSLPKLLVEPPVTNGRGTLIRADILKEYLLLFSAPFNDDPEHKSGAFSPKYLNIVDPLKNSNNLGRSVGIGNFHRIVSAFRYGAQRLSSVLQLNKEDIASGINKFFANTLLHRYQRIDKKKLLYTSHLLYASPHGQDELKTMSTKSPELNTLDDSGKQVMKNAGTHAPYKSIVKGINKTYAASNFKALTGDFELHFGHFLYARLYLNLINDLHHTPSQRSLAQDQNKEYLHAAQRQNLMCYLRPDQLLLWQTFLPPGFYLERQPFTPSDSYDKDASNEPYGTGSFIPAKYLFYKIRSISQASTNQGMHSPENTNNNGVDGQRSVRHNSNPARDKKVQNSAPRQIYIPRQRTLRDDDPLGLNDQMHFPHLSRQG